MQRREFDRGHPVFGFSGWQRKHGGGLASFASYPARLSYALDAERKLGGMLRDSERAQGKRNDLVTACHQVERPTLSDIGITKRASAEALGLRGHQRLPRDRVGYCSGRAMVEALGHQFRARFFTPMIFKPSARVRQQGYARRLRPGRDVDMGRAVLSRMARATVKTPWWTGG